MLERSQTGDSLAQPKMCFVIVVAARLPQRREGAVDLQSPASSQSRNLDRVA